MADNTLQIGDIVLCWVEPSEDSGLRCFPGVVVDIHDEYTARIHGMPGNGTIDLVELPYADAPMVGHFTMRTHSE